ncbi:hypothetical protein DPMN_017491 [Dreissena polymorpha]|uniref:Uncharacterized protein n=1 Tax=Dreissena polymorpha TaxID=45954 RepID=A0A9D4NGS9_DREPO|nr:hypothetical protein DPMN_017491 [Dreissena polymorpha]
MENTFHSARRATVTAVATVHRGASSSTSQELGWLLPTTPRGSHRARTPLSALNEFRYVESLVSLVIGLKTALCIVEKHT